MPILCTMGLKKIFLTPAGTTPGEMPAKGPAWLDLGDVYKDTCQLLDDDVEETTHESENHALRRVCNRRSAFTHGPGHGTAGPLLWWYNHRL